MQRKLRLVIDILMTLLMPLLMAYSLIGEVFHEVAGTLLLVLFTTHVAMNRKWLASVFKGRYSAVRIFRTMVNILLLVFMVLQPLSGILMSKNLYTFLPSLPVSAQARGIHMVLAYWGYVLICTHAGTHLQGLNVKVRQKSSSRIMDILLGLISAYGCYAFVKRGFPGYMSGRTLFAFFDFSEPLIFFFLDYVAVMILFMAIGLVIVRSLSFHRKK